jgi:NCS2 family nucleobase:cation symporter-2
LGGAVIMMFGNIFVCGLRMISSCGFNNRNMTIAAVSLAIGIGFAQEPKLFVYFPDMIRNIATNNCVVLTFVVAVLLNSLLPQEKEKHD